ncbi:hypothetical protein [Pseudonocardia nigra]|uniref:hypothetical protein n=1 Tax=Pseudonocardia nigra TaxID=1921578 RepID=UPI001C5F1B02|nr:hypothetical protein [Pseudonocardia nigra]
MTTTDPRTAPPTHQTGRALPHQRSPQAPHQPLPHPPEPTHRIVTPPSPHPDRTTPEPEWDDQPQRPSDRLGEAFAGLRFVSSSPGSLRDQIEYARDGAYTTRAGGPWRTANIAFARFIASPGLTICYFIAWAFFTRLMRTVTTLVVAVPLLIVLNGVPVVGWFVPDWADVTTWF